jgi:hypothetical protein
LRRGRNWSSNNEWDDPTVVELGNLLSIDLGFAFQRAVRKIVESGYSNEEAVMAVSTVDEYKIIGLNDVETNILESVKKSLISKSKSTRLADLNSAAGSAVRLLVTETRRVILPPESLKLPICFGHGN